MPYYPAIKRDKLLIQKKPWVYLNNIMLSERSPYKKEWYCVIQFI